MGNRAPEGRGKQIRTQGCSIITFTAKLDRLHIIELLPGNRIKLRIDENFSWLPNGPIERFFEREVQTQFLKSGFNSAGSLRVFVPGLLSERSQDAFTGKLLALREWEFAAFKPFSHCLNN